MKIKNHCECDDEGVLRPEMACLYDPVNELPFVKHEPGKCKCTNDLKLYKRKGNVLTLCSCCFLSTDVKL